MKKKHGFFCLSLALVCSLFGCGNESHSSIDNSEEESGQNSQVSSQESFDYMAEDSKEGLLDAFYKMKETGNYTVANDVDGSEYLFTKKYYRKAKEKTAYANLPYHRDGSRMLAYKIAFDQANNPYVTSMSYYTDAYGERHEVSFGEYNIWSSLSSDLSKDIFVTKNSSYYTENSSVLAVFANFYGVNQLGQVSFWFDEGNTRLNFELFNSANTSIAVGSFFHITNTKDEKLEEYVNGFSWEKDARALTSEEAGDLLAENCSSTTEINYASLMIGKKHIATVDFKCNKDTIYIRSVNDPEGENRFEYVNYIKEEGDEGRAYAYGLNPQNIQTHEETRYFFSQYHLPSELNAADFRLMPDGTFRYFSITPNIVYQIFGRVSINEDSCYFENIDLSLKNGKADSIKMVSPGGVTGITFSATTTLKEYEEIQIPESYLDGENREIKRAMQAFDGTTSFRVTKTNDEKNPTRKETYFFDGKNYLIQKETRSSSDAEWEKEITGYHLNDKNQVVPFRWLKKKNKLIQSDDIFEGDSLAKHFPNLINPYTITKNEDGTLSFKSLVNEINDSVWISNNADPSSVRISVDSKGFITKVEYQTLYSSYPNEYVTFEYSNISLPEGIDVNDIGPMELTSYSEDSPDEWDDLVNYIGEEYASLIPYYYDKKFVGQWFAEPRYSSGTGIPDLNEQGQTDYDEDLIGVGLYCFGSDTPTSVLDEGFVKNGFTKVASGLIDVGYRDDDYIANGYDSPIRYVDASKQTVYEIPGKLRLVYDNDAAFFHFSPNYKGSSVLGAGLLIQRLDGIKINTKGTFH